MCSSTLDSLHTGVSIGSIGCAYTYSGPFREAQISEQPLWGFPQVILIVPSHVPNRPEIMFAETHTRCGVGGEVGGGKRGENGGYEGGARDRGWGDLSTLTKFTIW